MIGKLSIYRCIFTDRYLSEMARKWFNCGAKVLSDGRVAVQCDLATNGWRWASDVELKGFLGWVIAREGGV